MSLSQQTSRSLCRPHPLPLSCKPTILFNSSSFPLIAQRIGNATCQSTGWVCPFPLLLAGCSIARCASELLAPSSTYPRQREAQRQSLLQFFRGFLYLCNLKRCQLKLSLLCLASNTPSFHFSSWSKTHFLIYRKTGDRLLRVFRPSSRHSGSLPSNCMCEWLLRKENHQNTIPITIMPPPGCLLWNLVLWNNCVGILLNLFSKHITSSTEVRLPTLRLVTSGLFSHCFLSEKDAS